MSDDSIRPGGTAADRSAQTLAFAERLLADQTLEQAAISAQIYARLKAGAELADVRGLIERLCATRTPAESVRPVESAGWPAELRLYGDDGE